MLTKIAKHSVSGEYGHENKIIHGDNIDVLECLREKYEGKVKCIYIDPPYNNGEIYTHYDDQSGHDEWLKNISSALKKLKPFLRKDGSIWISIDDNEIHYLKVAADKIFGRNNFVTTIVWQQRTTRENRKVFSNNHEYLLVYCIDQKLFSQSRNLLPPTKEQIERYKNPDNDPRGAWQSVSANVQAGHAVESQFYEIISPSGKKHYPPNGRCWVYNKQRMQREIEENNIWFGNNGMGVPRIKKFLSSAKQGVTPETIWLAHEVGTNKQAKKHILKLFPGKPVFDTPKPEQLIKRILDIATVEGDLVLDAYLGSGSSAAVAHKMKRQYIGIECGSHVVEYASKRLQLVVNGEQGGISKEVKWTGGGAFEFYRLVKKHNTVPQRATKTDATSSLCV